LAEPKTPANSTATLASVSCPNEHLCIAVGELVENALHAPTGPVRSFSVLIQR
jgi:hypothetical protein